MFWVAANALSHCRIRKMCTGTAEYIEWRRRGSLAFFEANVKPALEVADSENPLTLFSHVLCGGVLHSSTRLTDKNASSNTAFSPTHLLNRSLPSQLNGWGSPPSSPQPHNPPRSDYGRSRQIYFITIATPYAHRSTSGRRL